MEDSHKTVINEPEIEKEDGVRLILYSADLSSELPLDFADGGIRAGFPSPAQDSLTESIDLNRELVRHPATTFYARAVGDSMKDCGIDDGDLLVIDKAIDPQEGDIVVAYIDGGVYIETGEIRHQGRLPVADARQQGLSAHQGDGGKQFHRVGRTDLQHQTAISEEMSHVRSGGLQQFLLFVRTGVQSGIAHTARGGAVEQ